MGDSAHVGKGCPFCEIGGRTLVWESDLVVAFRDAYPVSPGHTLVVPRRHVETYFDAGPLEQAEIWRAVATIKEALDREFHPDGYNVGFNAGRAAGQTIFHLHVHVIPRFTGDVDDPRGGVRGAVPHKRKYGDSTVARTQPDPSPKPSDNLTGNPFEQLPTFVAGEDQHFVAALRSALQLADRADFLAAFVQTSGIRLLLEDLEDALRRGARIRVLTGDYLGITSADALRVLLRLQNEHPTFRAALYQTTPEQGFHPKSYLFFRNETGSAYVGSSNLSERALRHGIEWNLRLVSATDSATLASMARRFEQLWGRSTTAALSTEVISRYEARAPVPLKPQAEPREPPPIPHFVQQQVLEALDKTRAAGRTAGLVVLATGLGKTYLSAFDFHQAGGQRALYVAHREEILDQARAAWSRVFPDRTTGILGMGQHERDADLLFASIQTISRHAHLERFPPDHFAYVVVDEFHHAAAVSYRKVISHFRPRFLLGLTATPDRLDGLQLLELCEENEVYRRSIIQGISDGLLVPFKYFGVPDEVDFAPIPWRSNNFDIEALTKAVATRERAEQALREYRKHAPEAPRRTLAFCCSTRHADYMAEYFRSQGIAAAAVHSDPTSAPRAESIRQLRDGTLEIICAVDVFNEGVDIPQINTVLMLRPTLSPVVFLQQLGRGLRPAEGKSDLRVVDFIGNHRSFLRKLQGLAFLTSLDLTAAGILARAREKQFELPAGCEIDIETEAIDMLEKLARTSRIDLLIYEYLTFRDAHGRRPTAVELHAAGVGFKAVRDRFTCWFDFVREQGDLTEDEQRVLERHPDWLHDLLKTPMSKAYKMIALRVMLDAGLLLSGTTVAENAEAAFALARRQVLLEREMQDDRDRGEFGEAFIRKWKAKPLQVWADAEGTTRRWFALDGERFLPRFEVEPADRDAFERMTDELVELRLRERIDQLAQKTPDAVRGIPITMAVSHAGGRPILRFDRSIFPSVPEGETVVELDGEPYVLHFVKIAVNVATAVDGQTNLLPMLMRRWFGPNAGLPGSRHRVQLIRADEKWRLVRAAALDAPDDPAEVIPFPRLPFFPDLKVACGALGAADPLSFAESTVAVGDQRSLDPKQQFVVRAAGDSMDGGDHPIRNGDLVLCEWWRGGPESEVVGRPFLLVGHETVDSAFHVIKVPIRQDGVWILRSWNPTHVDQTLPASTRLEPVAKILGVVEEATGLQLWGQYSRGAIAAAFGARADRSWQVGHRDVVVAGRPHTVLIVTLRKPAETKKEHRYADRFVSREEFQWESQATTKPDWLKGRRVIHHEAEGRTLHLFVRYEKSDEFTYCGPIRYGRHEGEAPMRVWCALDNPVPEPLWERWKM